MVPKVNIASEAITSSECVSHGFQLVSPHRELSEDGILSHRCSQQGELPEVTNAVSLL